MELIGANSQGRALAAGGRVCTVGGGGGDGGWLRDRTMLSSSSMSKCISTIHKKNIEVE